MKKKKLQKSLRSKKIKLISDSKDTSATQLSQILSLQVDVMFELEFFKYGHLIKHNKGLDILDLGCGNGMYAKKLFNKNDKNRFYCVDANQDILNLAIKNNKKNSKMHFVQSSLFDLSINNKFDIIFVRALLIYHPDKLNDITNQFKNFLKPDGRVILLEPDDNLNFADPRYPFLTKMIEKRKQVLKQGNGVIRRIPQSLEMGGFAVDSYSATMVNKYTVKNKNQFYQLIHSWCALLNNFFPNEFDNSDLKLARKEIDLAKINRGIDINSNFVCIIGKKL